jgi:hypothetical protein
VCEDLEAPYARRVTSQHERRLHPLILYRYAPNHLTGLVAVLLFLVAMVLGAGVAVLIRAFI